MNPILEQALTLAAAGVSVVPVRRDGSKRPAGEWKEFQERRASFEELSATFEGGDFALGIITGAISGNLEMAEIEGRAAYQIAEIQQLAYDSGFGPLWVKVCNGWLEESPSGGMHWFYRLTETPGKNTKLAARPASLEELAVNPNERRKVLTETRGEGGFVVVAPSDGPTHETGRPWRVIAGGPSTVPTLTPEEHEQFHALLASINEEPPAPEPVRRQQQPAGAGSVFGAVTPGDDFEEKTDWADILVPAGWRFAFQDGAGVRYWTRPGKSSGISATTGKDPERDRLFVFTSASDFEQETPYTKFGAYTHLNHGGNHSAAASALRKSGMGKDPQIGLGARPSTSNQPPTPSSPFAATAVASGASGSSPAAPSGTPSAGPEWSASSGVSVVSAPASSPLSSPDWTTKLSDDEEAGSSSTGVEGNLATVTELRPRNVATIAHSDDGNAARLIAAYGRVLRFNPDRGRWLHWTGSVWKWQPASGGAARELAKDTIRAIEPDGDADRQWKKKSLSAAAITSMLVQAQTDHQITVDADELDANGWELNTPAGIIDLRTGTLGPANPESLHTKTTSVSPDFEETSETFARFLEDTFEGTPELRDFMQRLAGYSAIGIVREQILPFMQGPGANGKGVLFETLKAILGDYATSAPPAFLMKTGFQSHPTDLARLHGARLVINSETNAEDKFDEAKVKQLAGGDSITARFMRQDNFTFEPTHQLWLMGNYRPAVEAGGPSFWRRFLLIPFPHVVPEHKKIVGLERILSDEENGPRVLAWVARGAAAYYREGLGVPAIVREATDDYRREADSVARFLEDEATVHAGAVPGMSPATPCNAVINAYERWCRNDGATVLKGKALQNALAEHGVRTGKDVPKTANGQRQYLGISLNASTVYHPADDNGAGGTPFAQGKAW